MLESASREQWGRLRADVSRLVAGRLPTRADVEDVVQEVLLRVWKHEGSLRDEERFGAWLSRVAYTAAADYMRARQRSPLARYDLQEREASGPTAGAMPAVGGEEPDAKALIAAVLRPFVAVLPSPYRETIALSELDGLGHAVIASRLGLSVSAVKSRVQRGRDQLRQMLERCCEIALDARGAPMSCQLRPDGEPPPGCCCSPAALAASGDGSRPAAKRNDPR